MRFSEDLPEECIQRLKQINLIEAKEPTKSGYCYPFKSKLSFLHPQRHIPPTNTSDDINMSTYGGYTFANCRSM